MNNNLNNNENPIFPNPNNNIQPNNMIEPNQPLPNNNIQQMNQPNVVPQQQASVQPQPNSINNTEPMNTQTNVIEPIPQPNNVDNNQPPQNIGQQPVNIPNNNPNKKSKKTLLIIILIILILLAIALTVFFITGKNSNNTENNTQETEKIETSDNTAKEEAEDNNDSTLLTGTYNVPLEDIYIDVPGLNKIESGYSRIFMENESKYVAFTCLYEETGTDAKNAFEITFNKFLNNISSLHYIEGIKEVEHWETTINGIDTYVIKGTVNSGSVIPYESYIYGYSFVFGGYPTSIFGVVMDEDQPQEDIDNITEIVDAMMKTVRSEE